MVKFRASDISFFINTYEKTGKRDFYMNSVANNKPIHKFLVTIYDMKCCGYQIFIKSNIHNSCTRIIEVAKNELYSNNKEKEYLYITHKENCKKSGLMRIKENFIYLFSEAERSLIYNSKKELAPHIQDVNRYRNGYIYNLVNNKNISMKQAGESVYPKISVTMVSTIINKYDRLKYRLTKNELSLIFKFFPYTNIFLELYGIRIWQNIKKVGLEYSEMFLNDYLNKITDEDERNASEFYIRDLIEYGIVFDGDGSFDNIMEFFSLKYESKLEVNNHVN